jgi:hypothetical protein
MSLDSALKSDGSSYAPSYSPSYATTTSRPAGDDTRKPSAHGSKKSTTSSRRASASVTSAARTTSSPHVVTRSSSKRLSKSDHDVIAEDAKRWNPLYTKTGIFDPRVSTVTEEGSEYKEKRTVYHDSKSCSRNGSLSRHRTIS